jgi:glutathionylspermidine synthase
LIFGLNMQRISLPERPNWRERARALGFHFEGTLHEPYWIENAAYQFPLQRLETDLEAVSNELHALCLDAVERAIDSEEVMATLPIPRIHWDFVRRSWKEPAPSLYGRLDLAYTGDAPAKLLEYNADTPTSLYEAAVFQWYWLEEQKAAGHLPESADQWNRLHEALIERLRTLDPTLILHLTGLTDTVEDLGTMQYLQECAQQAGLTTELLDISGIGIDPANQFTDLQDRRIGQIFKLYPWENLFQEPYAKFLETAATRWVEPAWKSVLSNKAILCWLWRWNKNHPNLLATAFSDTPEATELGKNVVRKPRVGREGANITILKDGEPLAQEKGDYETAGFIDQAYAPLLATHTPAGMRHAVIGAWIVGDEAVGMGIRESAGLITTNTACFVPHVIL